MNRTLICEGAYLVPFRNIVKQALAILKESADPPLDFRIYANDLSFIKMALSSFPLPSSPPVESVDVQGNEFVPGENRNLVPLTSLDPCKRRTLLQTDVDPW